MLINYVKTAFRNLRNGGWYSVLNIGGLAVVLAVSVLLFWWVKDELSFDRFHADADRIYQVRSHFGKGADEQFWNGAPAPVALGASRSVPGVEQSVRISDLWDFRSFKVEEKLFVEKNNDLAYADEHFLNLFGGFEVLYGNRTKPFPTPNSVVMTEQMAQKFFGTANAVGKVLTVVDSNRTVTVSAVLANMPDNSSIQKKIFFPMSLRKRLFGGNGEWKRLDDDWGNYAFQTYLKLSPDADPQVIGAKLTALQTAAQGKESAGSDYLLQPFTSVHLYEANGKDTGMQQVRMLGFIAILLLSIGCINYVNLTTARATRRAKEISVRKVVGAESKHLVGQLIAESLLTMGIALLISIVLIQCLMPFYRDLTGKTQAFSLFDSQVWLLLIAALVLTILLAGIYPAVVIASFEPLRSLGGRRVSPGQAGLRQKLVVVQFALAVGLLIGTFVIGGQLRFIQERNLGFDKEHTFVFNAGDKAEQYKRELSKESSIRAVVTTMSGLLGGGSTTGDIDWDGKAPGRSFIVNQLGVSADFIPAYDIKLVAGQNFSGTKADSTHYILNETAVRQAGITNPIGKRFAFHRTEGEIIGVVQDFSNESARKTIQPMLLFSVPQYNSLVHVKTTGQHASQAIAAAEKLWKKDKPGYPFEYSFLNETYNRMYRAEQRTGQLFNFFAGVAIFISCLGLFGLAAFTAEQRTKEIGVRKALGASVGNIIGLLSKDFLELVLIAILIAFPIAWFAMDQWLENFAYKIEIEWWMFALAALFAVGIALLTVSFQSVKAALMNPVKSLRSE